MTCNRDVLPCQRQLILYYDFLEEPLHSESQSLIPHLMKWGQGAKYTLFHVYSSSHHKQRETKVAIDRSHHHACISVSKLDLFGIRILTLSKFVERLFILFLNTLLFTIIFHCITTTQCKLQYHSHHHLCQ